MERVRGKAIALVCGVLGLQDKGMQCWTPFVLRLPTVKPGISVHCSSMAHVHHGAKNHRGSCEVNYQCCVLSWGGCWASYWLPALRRSGTVVQSARIRAMFVRDLLCAARQDSLQTMVATKQRWTTPHSLTRLHLRDREIERGREGERERRERERDFEGLARGPL